MIIPRHSEKKEVMIIPRRGEKKQNFVGAVSANVVETEEELEVAPQHFEEGVTLTAEHLLEIDLGNSEQKRPTFIGAGLSETEQRDLIQLLKEYLDCFAWAYDEMPGLASEVALHHLSVRSDVMPIQQSRRKYSPVVETQIAAEIKKLIEANFIREVQYPTWLANIVPVKKKNGQIRICVDFRDLNKACPKDAFPLPIPDILLDIVVGHEMFSFMDGFSGYNQIKMAPEDEEKTAFYTPVGVYCYRVMSFGLKNAGATY